MGFQIVFALGSASVWIVNNFIVIISIAFQSVEHLTIAVKLWNSMNIFIFQ